MTTMTMKNSKSKSTGKARSVAASKVESSSTKTTAAKPAARELTRGESIRMRWGAGGAKGLYVAGRAGLWVLSGAAIYLLAMYVSVKMVPNVMVMVQRGTGIPSDADLPLLLAGWIVPSVFLLGLLFALTVTVMRGIWRWQRRQALKLRGSLVDPQGDVD